jgi:transposase
LLRQSALMARQVRPWSAQPAPARAPRVRVSDRGADQQIPIRDSEQVSHGKSGCTGAIYPSSRRILRAWQAGGVHVRLYFQVHEHAISGVEVIGFCRHLLRHVPGKLRVLWDGAPIHRSRTVKQYLHEEAGERLHLERFPGYAPELDPQEGIWRHLKHVELRNVCCASLAEIRKKLRGACQRLRQKPRIIRACIAHAGLV